MLLCLIRNIFWASNVSVQFVLLLTEYYVKSVGRCVPEENPPQFYRDLNCKRRCDTSTICTGYALSQGPDDCYTYTASAVEGDGDTRYECYTKSGKFPIKMCFFLNIQYLIKLYTKDSNL